MNYNNDELFTTLCKQFPRSSYHFRLFLLLTFTSTYSQKERKIQILQKITCASCCTSDFIRFWLSKEVLMTPLFSGDCARLRGKCLWQPNTKKMLNFNARHSTVRCCFPLFLCLWVFSKLIASRRKRVFGKILTEHRNKTEVKRLHVERSHITWVVLSMTNVRDCAESYVGHTDF